MNAISWREFFVIAFNGEQKCDAERTGVDKPSMNYVLEHHFHMTLYGQELASIDD